MSRNRISAKTAGTRFERLVADYLARTVNPDIDRRAKTGAKDKGDVSGLRHMGERLVVEVKNTSRTNLAAWAAEAETARGNDDAVAALIVHKRHGRGDAGDQWVTLTLADLVALLTGTRPEEAATAEHD